MKEKKWGRADVYWSLSYFFALVVILLLFNVTGAEQIDIWSGGTQKAVGPTVPLPVTFNDSTGSSIFSGDMLPMYVHDEMGSAINRGNRFHVRADTLLADISTTGQVSIPANTTTLIRNSNTTRTILEVTTWPTEDVYFGSSTVALNDGHRVYAGGIIQYAKSSVTVYGIAAGDTTVSYSEDYVSDYAILP